MPFQEFAQLANGDDGGHALRQAGPAARTRTGEMTASGLRCLSGRAGLSGGNVGGRRPGESRSRVHAKARSREVPMREGQFRRQHRFARPGCTHAWRGEGRGLHRQGQEEAIALDDGLEKGTAAEGEEREGTLADALCALGRGFWQIVNETSKIPQEAKSSQGNKETPGFDSARGLVTILALVYLRRR